MPKNEIPESEVVRVLQSGSGIENGKIRIAALFLSESDAKKRVDFLKEEYGTGGRTHYFEDGMDLCQYFEHKKLKGYADFFNSSSSFCCGVI